MVHFKKVSNLDILYYRKIRRNVSRFIKEAGEKYDKNGFLLDIAPQVHEGAAPYFVKMKVKTLDIDSTRRPTYVADICKNNHKKISDDYFDIIVCTEVLEHTVNPFAAIKEIKRILKPNGLLFLSTPFNFRIHGPLPDCWRFTEHGLRVLLMDFNLISLNELVTKDRWLMPIHYTVVAQKI